MYSTCAKCADSDHPAHVQNYNPSLFSPLIHFVVSNNSVCGQGKPRSECADAQADLGLRCMHMPGGTFSHCAARITGIILTKLFHA